MSNETPLSSNTQNLTSRIAEFATRLRDVHDELGTRIDAIVSAGVWIGPQPPTDPSAYNAWAKITAVDYDFLVNAGTAVDPIWTSILRTVKRPAAFGVPFKTSERRDGRIVWAVDVDMGVLPNNTVKVVQLPPAVTTAWSGTSERWIDTSNSYAYDAVNDYVYPLPMTSQLTGGGWFQTTRTDNILVVLDQTTVAIRTESDKRNLTGIIRVKYLTA